MLKNLQIYRKQKWTGEQVPNTGWARQTFDNQQRQIEPKDNEFKTTLVKKYEFLIQNTPFIYNEKLQDIYMNV